MTWLARYWPVCMYVCMTLTSEIKQMWHIYKYVLKYPFRQQTHRNVVLEIIILALALNTVYTQV